MEYIQCPHCLKKYGVNDKIRGASGKTIRCKGCEEPFEITVFSTPSAQPSAEESSETTEKEPSTAAEKSIEEKSEKKTQKSSGIKVNKKTIQIVITSTLAVALIAALVVAYQFLDNPLPIEASQTESSQTEVSQTEVAPQRESKTPEKRQPEEKEPEKEAENIKSPAEEKDGLPSESAESVEEANQPEEESPDLAASVAVNAGDYHGPSNPSDECKQAATNQWFTDYMITNGSISGKEYIRLLDESSNQTEEVLKLCKDKYLASRITEAAKLGKSPDWISSEIEARTSNRFDNGANKETEW
ncbi:MAG: MJ0042-type zinc finger domain-containing protein [Mariprofundaceae bacterium]